MLRVLKRIKEGLGRHEDLDLLISVAEKEY